MIRESLAQAAIGKVEARRFMRGASVTFETMEDGDVVIAQYARYDDQQRFLEGGFDVMPMPNHHGFYGVVATKLETGK